MKIFLKNTPRGFLHIEQWEEKCWINVEEPTPSEKQYLLDTIDIPEAFYNDIEDVDERPRIEYEDGWFLIIMRIPIKTNNHKIPFATIPLGIVFNDRYFASICFQKTDILSDFILFTQRKNISPKDNFDLVLRLHLSSSVWFLKYLKQINLNIRLAEQQLEKSVKNEDIQTLFQIEKCLVYFETSLKTNDILTHRIKNLREFRDSFDEDLLEDVDIELRQAVDMTKIHSDILAAMMDAYASIVSNNLNIIIKRLTSISIIIMIPTLIASIYGMNVPNFLEENKFAFVGIVIGSALIAAISAIILKKRNLF